MIRRTLLHLVLLCTVAVAAAQEVDAVKGRRRAVFTTEYYVSPTRYDFTPAARTIVGEAATDYEKAKRLFVWVSSHITYDTTGTVRTADEAWQQRRAVCQGYCELFYRLAQRVGVRSRLIYGKCRRPLSPALVDHVWLGISTERGEILADPTWGAGIAYGGRFTPLADPLLWYDVDPAWLIFSHLPERARRQYLEPAVTTDEFARLPFTTPLTSHLGLSGSEALWRVLSGGEPLPVVRMHDASWPEAIALRQLPVTQRLQRDSAYIFVVEKLRSCGRLALTLQPTDGAAASAATTCDESQWDSAGSTFSLRYTPAASGRLALTLQRTDGIFMQQQKIVEYVVE